MNARTIAAVSDAVAAARAPALLRRIWLIPPQGSSLRSVAAGSCHSHLGSSSDSKQLVTTGGVEATRGHSPSSETTNWSTGILTACGVRSAPGCGLAAAVVLIVAARVPASAESVVALAG